MKKWILFFCSLLSFAALAVGPMDDMGDDGFGDDWGDEPRANPQMPGMPPPSQAGANNPMNGLGGQPNANGLPGGNPLPAPERLDDNYRQAGPSSRSMGGSDKVQFRLSGEKKKIDDGKKSWRQRVFGEPWKTPDPSQH